MRTFEIAASWLAIFVIGDFSGTVTNASNETRLLIGVAAISSCIFVPAAFALVVSQHCSKHTELKKLVAIQLPSAEGKLQLVDNDGNLVGNCAAVAARLVCAVCALVSQSLSFDLPGNLRQHMSAESSWLQNDPTC